MIKKCIENLIVLPNLPSSTNSAQSVKHCLLQVSWVITFTEHLKTDNCTLVSPRQKNKNATLKFREYTLKSWEHQELLAALVFLHAQGVITVVCFLITIRKLLSQKFFPIIFFPIQYICTTIPKCGKQKQTKIQLNYHQKN